MMRGAVGILLLLLLVGVCFGAGKPHVIGFGKPISAKWLVGPNETQPLEIKVRGIYIDGRLKEFTVGQVHDVTDQLFVVRRVFHFNDALPGEGTGPPKWRWQRGGWLLVDRVSGHISQLVLAEFDTYYSTSSWYRDYVAYCGISDDGEKLYAVVSQIGRRKPILRKPLGEATGASEGSAPDMPDSGCPARRGSGNPPRSRS